MTAQASVSRRHSAWVLPSQLSVSTAEVRIDIAFTFLMFFVAIGLCTHWGVRPNFDLRRFAYIAVLVCLLITPVVASFFFVLTTLSGRWKQLRHRKVDWLNVVRYLGIMIPIAWIYSHIKCGVFLGRETWDATFHQWDRFLCFGHDPVALTRTLIPEGSVVFLLLIYKLFKLVYMGAILWLILDCRKTRALRLTAALVICYHLGALGYHLAPSYGPAYFVAGAGCEALSNSNHHLQQLLLHHVREVQSSPSSAIIQPWVYIGAFPSLHISHTLILWWFFRYSRIGFLMTGMFAVLTAVSTLLFGWHYLIDWMGGAILAAVSIWLAGIGKMRIPVIRLRQKMSA